MSLLTIVQDACRDLSLPVLTSVVGNSTGHAPLMLRVAKEELNSLATRHSWQRLIKENTFSATATSAQVTASAIPSDFDRMVNESMFNRTTRRHVWGPLDSVQWQYVQASLVTLVDPSFRIRGGTIHITPTPTSGNTIAYEYISLNKARTSASAEQENWAADADTSVFKEEIVTLGVVWRYRRAKGFAFNADQEEYERRVAEAIMRDGTRSRITTDPAIRFRSPAAPQMPETLTGLS